MEYCHVSNKINNVSENLLVNEYSRHSAIIGKEVMRQVMGKKIFIYGLGGLGSEIAKNTILVGPHSLTILDRSAVSYVNLSSNFYLSPEDVNCKFIDEAIQSKLKRLNPNTKVNILEKDINFDEESDYRYLLDYDVILISKFLGKETLMKLNKFTRAHRKGLIVSFIFGLISTIFVDFGEQFKVYPSIQGKEAKKFRINGIQLINSNEIQIEINSSVLSLSNNCIITFCNINHPDLKFMNDMSFSYEKRDKKYLIVKNDSLFESLSNKRKILNNQDNLYSFGQVKETLNYDFLPFGTSLESIQKLPLNYLIEGRHEIIQLCLMSLFEFHKRYKRIVDEKSFTDCENFMKIAKEMYEKYKNFFLDEDLEEIDLSFETMINIINIFVQKNNLEIPSISSFIAGIVSNEIFKFFGIGIPIFQWLRFDFLHLIENENIQHLSIHEETSKQNRYSNIISMFGYSIFKKISTAKIFVIGAGAIGSEILKILALMGVATEEGGVIYVADYDNIELSNLNRQFLFDRSDIGKPKSEIACQKIKSYNPSINIISYTLEVSEKTESTFSQNFWRKLDYIFLAVDSNKARYYIDDKVVEHNLVCFETGIEGFEGSCQIVIPNYSISIRDRPREEEVEVAACTIHSFPYKVEHIIQYAKENIFSNLFEDIINDINFYFYDQEKFYNRINEKYTQQSKSKIFKEMLYILNIYDNIKKGSKNDKNEKLIEYAINTFERFFNLQIAQLIQANPNEKLGEDGNLFWSGNKIFPSPIQFNPSFSLHKDFVYLFVKIFYNVFNLDHGFHETLTLFEETDLISMTNKMKNFTENQKHEITGKLEELLTEEEMINKLNGYKSIMFKPQIFQKDDDDLLNLNFIHVCATIRGQNYKLEDFDILKTKVISGNISVSIVHSSCSIAGFSLSQMMKEKLDDRDKNLEIYFNMATNQYSPKKIMKKLEYSLNVPYFDNRNITLSKWNFIHLRKKMTIKEFSLMLNSDFLCTLTSIIINNKYSLFRGKNDLEKIQQKFIEEVAFKKMNRILSDFANEDYLLIECVAYNFENLESKLNVCSLPKFKYYLNSN
jgi:ubiquitin-activating enzyme E1